MYPGAPCPCCGEENEHQKYDRGPDPDSSGALPAENTDQDQTEYNGDEKCKKGFGYKHAVFSRSFAVN
jgi:hypothetical protein